MYVKRNQQGEIIAISTEESQEFVEKTDKSDSGLIEFINKIDISSDNLEQTFKNYDDDFIRVLEDLINLLSKKGVIQFTELPKDAQTKLNNRFDLRTNVNSLKLFDENAL